MVKEFPVNLMAVTILLSSCLAFSMITGCTADQKEGILDDEIAMFQQKLEAGASFAEACNELQVLCDATGFGCKAHELFCKVPTKDYICQQLAAACIHTPAACDVYNDHCGSPNTADAGPLTQDECVMKCRADPANPNVMRCECKQPVDYDGGPVKLDRSVIMLPDGGENIWCDPDGNCYECDPNCLGGEKESDYVDKCCYIRNQTDAGPAFDN